jgi:hypothetical protein
LYFSKSYEPFFKKAQRLYDEVQSSFFAFEIVAVEPWFWLLVTDSYFYYATLDNLDIFPFCYVFQEADRDRNVARRMRQSLKAELRYEREAGRSVIPKLFEGLVQYRAP